MKMLPGFQEAKWCSTSAMALETITHHRYANGLLVELVIDNGNGDVSTVSLECDFADDERVLVPRGELPAGYEERIQAHLEEANYRLELPQSPA